MKKLTLTTAIAVILLLCLAAAAFANPAVTLLLNGEAVVTDVPPLLTGGRVMVPLRVIAEAFGAAVAWEEETNSVRVDMRETGTQPRQLQLLEEALAPQTPLAAAETWAEGVKMRNGALQYAMLDYELREEMRPGFAAMNWTTGTSSPWVKNYAVRETYRADNAIYRFAVEFVYTDSTEATFLTREYVTVNQVDGKWLITAIEKVDVAGEITTVTVGADNAVQSVFVEGDPASLGSYDKANVIIGSGTKIYEAYTDREMTAAALQEGTEVAVTFTDDPRIMIYPAVAEARTIRVLNDSPISGRIVYENNPYGFRFLLPEGWRGYSITQAEWEGAKEGKTVETGPVISLRHPEWTAEVPRQDIPVMIFTLTQWEAMAQAEFHIGAAPIGPSELGRNSKYVFALPARYNYAFPAGYEEVAEILASDPLQPLEPAGNEEAETSRHTVLVYFTNTEEAPGGLYPVIRNVPQEADPVQAAVAEMLRGPTPEEYAAGCRSLFSERTTGMLNGITRSPDGATLTLDFADFREMLDISGTTPATSFGPGGVMADITWAVFKQFPTVQGLRFAFDGDEEAFWTWLAGETSEPDVFTRTDWEQV